MRARLFPVLILLFVLAACGMQTSAAQPAKPTPSSAASCTSSTWAIPLPPKVPAGASTSSATGTAVRMKMGPHMKMTAYRKPTAAEVQRAQAILHMVSVCLAKYKDYRLALRDGYQ